MELRVTKREFIELYNTLSYRELQHQLGLNPNQISALAKFLGLSKPRGRRKNPIVFLED